MAGERRTAQLTMAAAARSAAQSLPTTFLRVIGGKTLRVLEVVEADPASVAGSRTVEHWKLRFELGRDFDREQGVNYRFNQLYVVKSSGKGYWVLDSYAPRDLDRAAGPVSRKFTQLADLKPQSARDILREANKKYRVGTAIADVDSRPAGLRDTHLKGQLWLEVPVQSKPIPADVLAVAQSFHIQIRDVTGRVY